MRRLAIALGFLALLTGCSGLSMRREGTGGQIHNVVQCSIYGMDQRLLRQFRGGLCAFLPDGRVAYYNRQGLTMDDPTGKLLWHRDWVISHQLNLDRSNTHLLTLARDFAPFGENWPESDTALVVDLQGNVVHSFNLAEHWKELEALTPWQNRRKWQFEQDRSPKWAEFEHANSIYEIPENDLGAVNPAFRAGNYIINALGLDIVFVVDHEMKHLLWGSSLAAIDAIEAHDVQVLPNGHLLYYRNEGPGYAGDFHDHDCCSSLVEFDLTKEAPVWTWSGAPELFYSPVMGGVQILDNGNVLFNHGGIGIAREITRAGEVVWSMRNFNARMFWPLPYQQIKRYDLSSFLEHNRNLASLPFPFQRAKDDKLPNVLWGYADTAYGSGRLIDWALRFSITDQSATPPLELAGLEVKVNGVPAPIFLAARRYFAAEIPPGIAVEDAKDVEVYCRGRLRARISTKLSPLDQGIYAAAFREVDAGGATRVLAGGIR